ncbi:unnamed protein product [Didymodactylos carnosus]|uniref:Uncharacterized protein n=1 Tax=Didymodactylos carnosus TaxID=1234261 RepID=A0A815C9F1_9BILA|nr:unnamed protein product [Didymodactylos carnosus]CAF4074476.1 unnamed protein product [Didymodactylos carnosus]CAF4101128.1 unnamed protein product [Didymodactylos carnosus]
MANPQGPASAMIHQSNQVLYHSGFDSQSGRIISHSCSMNGGFPYEHCYPHVSSQQIPMQNLHYTKLPVMSNNFPQQDHQVISHMVDNSQLRSQQQMQTINNVSHLAARPFPHSINSIISPCQNTNQIVIPMQQQQYDLSLPPFHQSKQQQYQTTHQNGDEGNNDNDFIPVRNNKKTKINHQITTGSETDSSASYTVPNQATSINTDSVIDSTSSYLQIPKRQTNNIRSNDIINGISQQARRFAETRYAFPPFIIKFNQNVAENVIIQDLVQYYRNINNIKIEFDGHRLKQKQELLLFVKNRESFAALFDEKTWPQTLGTFKFTRVVPKHLPPQFSIVLRNVPTDVNIDDLLRDIQVDYLDVINAFRIINKEKQPTTLVRLDISNPMIMNDLLSKKFIYANNVRYSLMEYMSPVKVLLCSKCFEIGHFRSSCTHQLDVCKTCGEEAADIQQHLLQCNKRQNCVRCKGDHESNDVRCPMIKSYRSALTKSLLTTTTSKNNNDQNKQGYFQVADSEFPLLDNRRSNQYNDRLSTLESRIIQLDDNLNRIIDMNERFETVLNKQKQLIEVQQIDVTFQQEFVSQFITPVCQLVLEVVPSLIEQNMVRDSSILASSLTAYCDKLTNEFTKWMTRHTDNEDKKHDLLLKLRHSHQQQEGKTTQSDDNQMNVI